MTSKVVDVMVDGGKASAGPPLGPALGPTGVNINEVINEINKKTADFAGMKIPVKIIIDTDTKKFDVTVGLPPTSVLIKKELGIEKGTKDGSVIGNMTFDQLIKIAKMKMDSLLANDIRGAVKEILGTCKTMGVTVEGVSAKEMTRKIDNGEFDDKFKNE